MRLCSVSIDGKAMMDFGPSNAPLTQFTGIKDKSGKDIYEGDVLEVSYYTFGEKDRRTYRNEVRWDQAGLCWEFAGLEFPSFTKPEVVGNIYENPELLSV